MGMQLFVHAAFGSRIHKAWAFRVAGTFLPGSLISSCSRWPRKMRCCLLDHSTVTPGRRFRRHPAPCATRDSRRTWTRLAFEAMAVERLISLASREPRRSRCRPTQRMRADDRLAAAFRCRRVSRNIPRPGRSPSPARNQALRDRRMMPGLDGMTKVLGAVHDGR